MGKSTANRGHSCQTAARPVPHRFRPRDAEGTAHAEEADDGWLAFTGTDAAYDAIDTQSRVADPAGVRGQYPNMTWVSVDAPLQ